MKIEIIVKKVIDEYYLTNEFPYEDTSNVSSDETIFNDLEFIGEEPDECIISIHRLKEIIEELEKTECDYMTIHYNVDKEGYKFTGFELIKNKQ